MWGFKEIVPKMMLAMGPKHEIIQIELTHEEAYELLIRCLQSPDHDTPVFHSAIKVLARAIKRHDEPVKTAS